VTKKEFGVQGQVALMLNDIIEELEMTMKDVGDLSALVVQGYGYNPCYFWNTTPECTLFKTISKAESHLKAVMTDIVSLHNFFIDQLGGIIADFLIQDSVLRISDDDTLYLEKLLALPDFPVD